MNTQKDLFIQRYPNLSIDIIENAIKFWTSKSLFPSREKTIQNLIDRTKENEYVTLEYLTKNVNHLQ